MLIVVPLLMIGSVYAALPKSNILLEVIENTVTFKKTVDQRDVTIAFVTLFTISFLAGFFGFYLMLSARQVDHRLVLCGYRPMEIVTARGVILVVLCVALTVYVTLVLLPFFVAQNVPSFVGGLFLCSLIYGFYGELVGVLIARELEGSYIVMVLPFIDTGYLEVPGFSTVLHETWMKFMPGYFPARITIDSGFTAIFDAGHDFAGAAVYAAGLWLAASALFWYVTRRYVRETTSGGELMRRWIPVGALSVAMLAAVAYVAWPYAFPSGIPADGHVTAPHAEVVSLWDGTLRTQLVSEGQEVRATQHLAIVQEVDVGTDHWLSAPIAGTITKAKFPADAPVMAGDLVYEIHDLRGIEVQLDVEEVYIGRVFVGQHVDLRASGLDQPMQGQVTSIGFLPSVVEPQATGLATGQDSTVRKYPVKVALTEVPPTLRLDMRVHGVLSRAQP